MSLGLAFFKRTVLVWLHCAKCNVWMRGNYDEGLFFRSWTWPLCSSGRNSECFSIPRDVGQFHNPNFVGTVWGWPLLVLTWLCTNAQSKVHKHMEARVWCGWTWLACTESWPQPNRTPLGWIRAQTESHAFPSNISVCTNAHLEKWSKIPINTPKPCGKLHQKSWSCYSCKGWTNVILNPMD